jgi:hypothetical protein
MRDATPQERIAALRRVQEERRSTPTEEAEARRRRRLTARLHDVFSIHTTRDRERSPGSSQGEASHTTPRGGSVEAIPESQAENEFLSSTTSPAESTAQIEAMQESTPAAQESSSAVPAHAAEAVEPQAGDPSPSLTTPESTVPRVSSGAKTSSPKIS